MKTLFFIQNGRGPGKHTPACDNPNPPFWCDDTGGEVAASIDMYNYYILAFILLIAVVYFTRSVYINYKKQKQ